MTTCWTLKPGKGPNSLTTKETPRRPLEPGQVRVAMKALSLNARDLMVALGRFTAPTADELVPLSDGAGVVEEIGDGVSQIATGDRVVITFNPAHQDGPFRPEMEAGAHGGLNQGLLAEEVVLPERALVQLPASISFEQAACLPCVGVTAWNALFESGSLRPGQSVLATGTGNLSLVAMRLAKAAGARFGITSSDDSKLERAIELGADFGVNYRVRSEWEHAVHDATSGVGADVVLENAGPPSIATAIRAAAQDGRVMQIGFQSVNGPPINVLDLLLRGVRLIPVMVGSRVMLERLTTAVSVNGIELPIHARFAFADAPSAFEELQGGDSFGKIIISV